MARSGEAKGRTKAKAKAGADERSRQSRGQARKEQILAEAIEMFAARGFRGTSIADLADRVGMTHPGLLYYFGTKERLLEEAVGARQAKELETYLGVTAGGDGSIFQLAAVARFTVSSMVLTRLYVVLGAENLDPGDPLHEFFVTRYDQARRFAVAVLQQDVERGDVRADVDAEQIALEVVATLMGLEIQWLMDPQAVDLVGAVRSYIDGLRVRLAP